MATTDTSAISSKSTAILLATLGRTALRRLRGALEASGLNPRQFQLLATLHERGPVSQQGLGELLAVDPSILVTLLNPLEDAGLVSRRRDPADRRRHNVELTDEGAARFEEAAETHRAAEEELLAALDADQCRQLQELLLELERTAAAPADDACDAA